MAEKHLLNTDGAVEKQEIVGGRLAGSENACTVRQLDDFAGLDQRFADRGLQLVEARMAALTHQQLASELGTAREVISRQLHEFQRRNWISATRGEISLLAPKELKNLAGAP